jgi:hypothetical protein
MKREYGRTPNGNLFRGQWVLRNNETIIDFNKYRSDILSINNLDLERNK